MVRFPTPPSSGATDAKVEPDLRRWTALATELKVILDIIPRTMGDEPSSFKISPCEFLTLSERVPRQL